MVQVLSSRSVTVDLAVESGGNAETTAVGQAVTVRGKDGQTIRCVGYADMPSRMASIASQNYSKNVTQLIQSMDKQGKCVIYHNDEAVRSMLFVDNGIPLEPCIPLAAPKRVAKTEDPAKEKVAAAQKNAS